MWDLPPLLSGLPRPMVLGAIAHATGLAAAEVAEVVGYDDLQTVASAALKLQPLDPAVATSWVVAALPRLAVMVDEVAHLDSPADIPATASPWIEQLAEDHAVTTRRLFRA
ncbi:urease accessory UreF family protein [Nocardioides sp. T5]|uniref:urease accessory UreF family protein n=1 Tax=Nocardioides sp. T5 TaxID=3400182 RepID=UPI003A86CABC